MVSWTPFNEVTLKTLKNILHIFHDISDFEKQISVGTFYSTNYQFTKTLLDDFQYHNLLEINYIFIFTVVQTFYTFITLDIHNYLSEKDIEENNLKLRVNTTS